MDELIVSIDSGRNVIDDHNWNRKKVRFCVENIGDVSVSIYYREKETGNSKQPSRRVVVVEDL